MRPTYPSSRHMGMSARLGAPREQLGCELRVRAAGVKVFESMLRWMQQTPITLFTSNECACNTTDSVWSSTRRPKRLSTGNAAGLSDFCCPR
jgi:hypothetical protein